VEGGRVGGGREEEMYRGNMRKRQNKEEKTNEINSKKRDEIGCFARALLGKKQWCIAD
jgi:hypothetical protein